MKECQVCALNQSNPASAPVHSWENTSHPWERLHLDFAGPFLGKMFLVVVDAHSKWVEVEIMNNVTSVGTIHKLRKMFATHGLPLFVVSDNGPAFVGEEFEMFLKKNGIRHIRTAPYHPSSNGQAERMVRMFKESMKTLQSGDVETKLNRLLFRYRITPHTTTGTSPAEIMFNRELRSEFHHLKSSKKVDKIA